MSDFIKISKKDKVTDFAAANVEEMGNVLVKIMSEVLKGSSSLTANLIGTAVGGIFPVVGNVLTGWQIHTIETNLKQVVVCLEKHERLLNELKDRLNEEAFFDMLGIFLEKSLMEYQTDKVSLMSNGFISFAMMEEINMNEVISFFSSINQMTLEDIEVLQIFGLEQEQQDFSEFEDEKLYAIIDKLIRFGLLHDGRIDSIISNLEDLMRTVNTAQMNNNLRATGLSPAIGVIRKDCYLSYYGQSMLEMIREKD